jgi:hypothetical protein
MDLGKGQVKDGDVLAMLNELPIAVAVLRRIIAERERDEVLAVLESKATPVEEAEQILGTS